MKIERPPATLRLDTFELIEAVQEWLDKRFEHREVSVPKVEHIKEAELNSCTVVGSSERYWMGHINFTLKPESE